VRTLGRALERGDRAASALARDPRTEAIGARERANRPAARFASAGSAFRHNPTAAHSARGTRPRAESDEARIVWVPADEEGRFGGLRPEAPRGRHSFAVRVRPVRPVPVMASRAPTRGPRPNLGLGAHEPDRGRCGPDHPTRRSPTAGIL